MQYRKEIDGLRAIAVIPVILFHAGFSFFSGGFVGVDIFFVISGYLITNIILSEIGNGTFSIINFYERRARRILPAIFFVMLVCIPTAFVLLIPSDLKDFSQSVFSVTTFASNFLFWQESGYFSTAAELKPLLHTWSLAVEEQYYLLFPLFLLLVWKFRKRWILGSIVLIGISSLLLAQWASSAYPNAAFFLLPTRAWELMVGASIAFLVLYGKNHNDIISDHRAESEVLGFVGLILILVSIFVFDNSYPFPSFYTLVPVLGTGLIILFSSKETYVGRLFGTKYLVGIGLISYSTYLWHQPLLAFSRHYSFSEPNELTIILIILLTFVLSYLSWYYVEKPFRKKGVYSRKQIFLFSLFGSSILASLGLLGHFTNGFFEIKTPVEMRELMSTAISSPKRNDCHTGGKDYKKPDEACEYFNDNANWATFGDSHTVELAYALAKELNNQGEAVKHFSFSGCAPKYLRESKQSNCTRWTNEVVDYLANDNQIKNIVISYRINRWLFGEHINVYPEQPNNVEKKERDRRWKSYLDTVERFVNSGKQVFVILQAPELRATIEKLIIREGYINGKIISVPYEWWSQRNAYMKNKLNQFPKNVFIIDPSEIFCDTINCYAVKNNKSLYFDSDHMSTFGASLIAKKIIEASNQD